jgi:hypothetical protein
LTKIIDPPANIPELPCTIVLAEDTLQELLSKKSWHEAFSVACSETLGAPYTRWSTASTTFTDALTEMKDDLRSIPNIILVARGPWVSWTAQFYLESLPLGALIMIDPLPFHLNSKVCLESLEAKYLDAIPVMDNNNLPSEYLAIQSYKENPRKLLLEPGSVPMLILYSQENQDNATAVVKRHATTAAVEQVSFIESIAYQGDMDATMRLIFDWVEQKVL